MKLFDKVIEVGFPKSICFVIGIFVSFLTFVFVLTSKEFWPEPFFFFGFLLLIKLATKYYGAPFLERILVYPPRKAYMIFDVVALIAGTFFYHNPIWIFPAILVTSSALAFIGSFIGLVQGPK